MIALQMGICLIATEVCPRGLLCRSLPLFVPHLNIAHRFNSCGEIIWGWPTKFQKGQSGKNIILALLHKLNTYRVFRDVRPLKVFAGISDICATERFLKEK